MIYVHVPFCKSFCVYCDFYSERACPTRAWVDEVCAEARARRNEIEATAAVDTLYFGGGTPSVLPSSWLGAIADACGGRSWREWTVEVNPDDVSAGYASELRALGVNRVSMGVQSLDDAMLRWMNRRHDAACARRAFEALRSAGFGNISVDVIFGVDGMGSDTLLATVRELVSWRPEHISAYQLSVEEGSALGKLAREGRYSELPDEVCAEQYYLICNELAAAGYEHYEISNWALPGYRAVHNSAYWTRAPYVGLGPGAHSLLYAPNAQMPIIPLHPQGTGERIPPHADGVPLQSAEGLRVGPDDSPLGKVQGPEGSGAQSLRKVQGPEGSGAQSLRKVQGPEGSGAQSLRKVQGCFGEGLFFLPGPSPAESHPRAARGIITGEDPPTFLETFPKTPRDLPQNAPGPSPAESHPRAARGIITGEDPPTFLETFPKTHRDLPQNAPGPSPECDYRSWNSEDLSGWRASGERLSAAEIREERIMLALRTADGLPASVIPTGAPASVIPTGAPSSVIPTGAPSSVIPDLIGNLLVPSAITGNLRIPEDRWFTADDIISSILVQI
ncbi:MAG: radical SAM protein [Bacteroidales bacterium]|nr:radical SAM protein [Bacteroidales bacterium]